MIYEHEIPEGSRLYFGKSAALKRKIETEAARRLCEAGFEEIVTPFFSYHQHREIDESELLRFSNEANRLVSLRADSTLDVVRLITRRLGRTTHHKKWFYIQPVFRYPSLEFYQIGGELINQDDLSLSVDMVEGLLEHFTCKAYLQVSHIQIPKIISKMLDIPLEVLKSGQLETLLAHNEPWLNTLATLQDPDKIDTILDSIPDELRVPLLEMKRLASTCKYAKVIVAPLYYAKMRYYDRLFFRFVAGNKTIASGGQYAFKKECSSGFGVYTDALIETLMQ